ncbi:LOW QUALITY PROTEIN: protein cereblon-like [Acanthaster planci]|uniref:Protein cereblon n=1 Tax=Acanthaster planci TaxID=133434 RepID=A0A8B7Z9Y3_ACAPL|nr:LOW QUALITY PROTEIN: protein cereblon-like [Acanthaster planci]
MADDMDEDEEQLLPVHELEEELSEEESGNSMGDQEEADSPEEEEEEDHLHVGFLRRLHLRIRSRRDHDRVEKRPTKITYDPSLPTAHSYLGSDLEEYSGRTVLDEDTFISLPLLHLPGVILLPGQTLPLHLFNQRIISMMKHVIQNNRTFGMVHDTQSHDMRTGVEGSMSAIGTTAEIFSAKEEEDSGVETMRVKAMGRQRFQVMDTRRQTDGIVVGTVRIITEPELPGALEGAQLSSRNRLRPIPLQLQQPSGPERMQWLRERRKRHLGAANWTWLPPWVYEMYDAEVLMLHIKAELRSWYEDSVKFHTLPSNPSGFSFWVASNLPLNDTQRLKLLEINCPVQRLRLELDTLRKCTMLNCTRCGLDIANKSDVFSMSLDGPMAAYVNPAGYVHDTLTLYRAHNLNLVGRPSQENSWFPGYAWTILQCRHCDGHMGWKFTAAKRKLKPEMFWGLTRSAVQPGFKEASQEREMPLI